jgi:CTP:molybdopterin cytidylyltransferase MocA
VSTDVLILAAGGGSRFGPEPKLLADLHGRPVLQHVLEAARDARVDRVVVVVGAHAERVLREIDLGRAEAVVCEDWADGQSASLRRGLEALEGSEKVLVLLGDQPLVTSEVIDRMAAEPPGSRAVYDGVPGHPTVLGPEQIRRAMELRGDVGLRRERFRPVEVGRLASATDIDTPADLEAIRSETRAVL